MPSNKILEEKKKVVEALAEKLKDAAAGVLVKYEGIKVSEDTELRVALRKAGVEYMLVEQDRCYDEDPFDCLKKSYDYLKSLGLN